MQVAALARPNPSLTCSSGQPYGSPKFPRSISKNTYQDCRIIEKGKVVTPSRDQSNGQDKIPDHMAH
jgi:hypothetical protein